MRRVHYEMSLGFKLVGNALKSMTETRMSGGGIAPSKLKGST